MRAAALPAAALTLSLSGCSLNTLALRTTTGLMEKGAAAYHEEPDTQLAKEAIASQLKFVEALLRSEPGNAKLLLLSAEAFAGYTFLYVEDAAPARAKELYVRGRDYGLRALARHPALSGAADQPLEAVEQALAKAEKPDAPALFWSAFAWSGAINLSRDSAAAVADLPKAVAKMKRAWELDKEFHFGGPDLFFGVYYASRPAMLGGDNAKAKTHFEWARRLTAGKYLMAYVLEARYYAVAVQDRELFTALLTRVKDSPAGALPGARLTDEIAKEKAAALLEKADDLF